MCDTCKNDSKKMKVYSTYQENRRKDIDEKQRDKNQQPTIHSLAIANITATAA
jgi:hypothetical protein